VNLLVRLQIVECLEYSQHQLILSSYELLHLRVVVSVADLAIAGLTVALVVPCIHHLRDFFDKRDISFLKSKPQLYAVIFINCYLKDEVMDKVLKNPMTHTEHSQES
jgi:hypothetical protein